MMKDNGKLYNSDEMIDTDQYNKNPVNMTLSDADVEQILSDQNRAKSKTTTSASTASKASKVLSILSAAHTLMKQNKIDEFRKLTMDAKNIINEPYENKYLIHEACRMGKPEYVSFIMFLGGEPSIIDHSGFMGQHYAVLSYRSILIDILFLFNVDLNAQDIAGNTPLHHAVMRKNADMIKTLFSYKVDLTIKNYDNLLPIDYCENDDELIKLFMFYNDS